MTWRILILFAALAACGVDGDPLPVGPVTAPAEPTIGVDG